jgi:hypothetical protein
MINPINVVIHLHQLVNEKYGDGELEVTAEEYDLCDYLLKTIEMCKNANKFIIVEKSTLDYDEYAQEEETLPDPGEGAEDEKTHYEYDYMEAAVNF